MTRIKPSPRIECRQPCCTGALFAVPQHVDDKAKKTPVARYARYVPRIRTICADCVIDIHTRGVEIAPYPQPVRWRRTATGEPTLHLCQRHKTERHERESADDELPAD